MVFFRRNKKEEMTMITELIKEMEERIDQDDFEEV